MPSSVIFKIRFLENVLAFENGGCSCDIQRILHGNLAIRLKGGARAIYKGYYMVTRRIRLKGDCSCDIQRILHCNLEIHF